MDPADLARLGAEVGDIVELSGKRKTVAKAMPAYRETSGQARAQLDGVTRENAGVALDHMVDIRKIQTRAAERVVITPLDIVPTDRDLNYIGSLVDGLAVVTGDRIRAALFGARSADFKVAGTVPPGPVRDPAEHDARDRPPASQGQGQAEGTGRDALVREHRRTQA